MRTVGWEGDSLIIFPNPPVLKAIRFHFRSLALAAALAAAPPGSLSAADPSISARVDALIADGAGGLPIAGPADDAEFFRRVQLDFAGSIPTIEATSAFLDDSSADKRTRVIESLLNGEGYGKRMAEWFHLHLMERRADHDLWKAWLEKSMTANLPWDRMVREMIRADFRDEPNRGAAFFLSNRLEKYGQNATDYPGLTRDVGRLFLGMDLQCAECHNHLLIDD